MMCAVCGCSSDDHVHDGDEDLDEESHSHSHPDSHVHHGGHHHHDHDHDHRHGVLDHVHDRVAQESDPGEHEDRARERLVRLERDVLSKNSLFAARNRQWFEERGILALNFVSSPGSGKTTLLERIIVESGLAPRLFVVEGDQATDRDAERIRRAGARALQINTGAGCHLDALMVERAVAELAPPLGSIVAIENVGNLVCPALFDLGEARRVAILSVTEGDDKPIKYPYLFRGCHLVILNKMDLAKYVDFDHEKCLGHLWQVNPDARVVMLSAKTGEGLADLYEWLADEVENANSVPSRAKAAL